mgnify:CR=1 FL=1
MLLILWGVLIVLGLLFRKSRVLTAITMGFIITAVGFRTQGADYIAYSLEYEWSLYQKPTEVQYAGYLLIEKLAHHLGFSFQNYVLAVAIISGVLFYVGLRQLTPNVNFALSIFLVYPFGHEMIQMRTFMADAVMISILPVILRSDKTNLKSKLGKTAAVLIVGLIASSIHFEAIFCMIFLTASIWINSGTSRKVLPAITVVMLGLAIGNVFPLLLNRFNARIAYWLSSKASIGMIVPILITLYIWWMENIASKKAIALSHDLKSKIFYKNCCVFGQYIVLMVPFFIYDMTFNRVWRVFLVLMYAVISRTVTKETHKEVKGIRNTQFVLLVVLVAVLFIYENEFSIVNNAFANNALFTRYSII